MMRLAIFVGSSMMVLCLASGSRAADSDASATTPAPLVVPPTPSMLGPGRAADLVYAGVEGRWDGVRRGAGFETNVEAPLAGPFSLRAGIASNPVDGRASPSFLLKADLLNQTAHGIDGALFGGYRGEGFNLVPAVEVGVALARRSTRFAVLSSLAYGQGLRAGERYGDVRLAGLMRVHRVVSVGLDARARFDLEYDDDEPVGEAAVDGVAGPMVVVGLGRFSLSGQTGVGVVSFRSGQPTQVGSTTRLGIGASF